MSKAKTFINMEENSDEPVIVRGAAGKAPASLSQFIDDEANDCEGSACAFCGLLSCRCAYDIDAQEDVDEEELEEADLRTPSSNKRFEYDEGLEEPDLAAYFEQFELTEQQQIAMCRTYANYLSQKVRSKYGKYKKGEDHAPHGRTAERANARKWKRVKVRPLDLEGEQE